MITPETFAKQFIANCKTLKLNKEEEKELIRLFGEAEGYYAHMRRPMMDPNGFPMEKATRSYRSRPIIRKPRL